MKRYLPIMAAISCLLTGCIVTGPVTEVPIIQGPTEVTPSTDLVEMPPKTRVMSWPARLSPLIIDLLANAEIDNGGLLLLNDVKNSTNGYIATSNVTKAVADALANNGRFILLNRSKINEGKQVLGIAADDNLSSRSKAIGLARYLQAQYVLYTTLSGDPIEPTISMQLMLVSTGEIIWSENTKAMNNYSIEKG